MGMNYYIKCLKSGKIIQHIGKTGGSSFLSNITKEEFMNMKIPKNQRIVDEGKMGEYTKDEFLEKATGEWELYEGGKYRNRPNTWC